MPMPRWVAKVNKRFTNPMELNRGEWPVLTHVGRVSGVTYRTPLGAEPIDGGFIFTLVYGSDSDWAQNLLTSGNGALEFDGDTFMLENPRLISEHDARRLLSPDAKEPSSFLLVNEYLQVDVLQE